MRSGSLSSLVTMLFTFLATCGVNASAQQYNVSTGITFSFSSYYGNPQQTKASFYVSAKGLPSSYMQGREVVLTYTMSISGTRVWNACSAEVTQYGDGSCLFYAPQPGAEYVFTAQYLGSYDGSAKEYYFLPSSATKYTTCSPVCSN